MKSGPGGRGGLPRGMEMDAFVPSSASDPGHLAVMLAGSVSSQQALSLRGSPSMPGARRDRSCICTGQYWAMRLTDAASARTEGG